MRENFYQAVIVFLVLTNAAAWVWMLVSREDRRIIQYLRNKEDEDVRNGNRKAAS